MNWAGRLGIMGQFTWEKRIEREFYYYGFEQSYEWDQQVRERAWHIGVRIGGEPGIVSSAAFLLGEAIVHGATKYREIP